MGTISNFIHNTFDFPLFRSTFALIFIAELPDKTALATLLLATRGTPWAVFIGVAAAFLIQSLVAICFGSLFTHLPEKWVHCGTGLLFLGFAYLSFVHKDPPAQEASTPEHKGPQPHALFIMWNSFLMIFISEWGDLTQLATASLTARYQKPFTIFISSTLALWTISALAIMIGDRLKHSLKPAILNRIAALAYFGVGLTILFRWAFLG